jgi:alkanesulfonate monooxygenase SsuD/methylene tetrahydromethanopterin reductase-like flavin-dependent oxidoreductase (luciferase family)
VHLDYHLWRFDWAGGSSEIGNGVADLAQRAEALGVRTLSVMDHWFQMEAAAPPQDPMLEAYSALAFIAGRTSTLRLRTLVTGVTYRYPGLLAKTVTTLDVVSGGRAELGIGAAWYEREHRGLGVPFPPVA